MSSIFEHFAPPKELAPYLRQVMVTHNESPIHIPYPAWPSGYSFFHYIHRGTFQGSIDGAERNKSQGSVFIAGVIDKQEIMVTVSGKYSQIVSEFTALGQYQLTGALGCDCQGETVDTSMLTPKVRNRCQEFITQCREQASTLTSYDCLQYWYELLGDLAQNPFETPEYLSDAIAKIEQAKGLVKLKELCEELEVSKRQFNRKFTEIVGISPKYFVRILQINFAMQAALTDDREYFSMIAAMSGYYDESHFIKAAKSFFDQPPKDFLRSEQDIWFELIRFKDERNQT